MMNSEIVSETIVPMEEEKKVSADETENKFSQRQLRHPKR